MAKPKRRGKKRTQAKVAAWASIQTMMLSRSTAAQSEAAHTAIVLPAYTALDRLALGRTDMDDFISINEMNAFAFCLAACLHERGTDHVREQMAPTKEVFEAAAEALASIGTRFNAQGRFGASGDELGALRASVDLLDQIVALAPQGVAVQALHDARELVARAR